MKNKISFTILLAVVLVSTIAFTGCSSSPDIAPENEAIYYENASKNMDLGITALKRISFASDLYYDTNTYIVYYWNGCSGGYSATMPTLYYSTDGNKCKYNPEIGEIYDMNNIDE